MPTVINGKVTYQEGERLPTVGSEEYKQAQTGVLPTQSASTSSAPKDAPVTSAALTSESPLNIPQTPTSTVADGISGAASAIADATKESAIRQEAERQRKEALAAKDKEKEALEDTYKEIIGVAQSRPKLEEEYGIEGKSSAYNMALTNLEASRRAQEKEIRAIMNNSNLTREQASQRAQEINRQYAFEQADLSLTLSVANRDLVSAQNMIDRKIQLTLEPLKIKLDYTKAFYEENRDALTKAEDRLFQTMIKDDERKYQETQSEMETVKNLAIKALEAGAPVEIVTGMNKVKTVEEALALGGKYLRPRPKAPGAPEVKNINGVDMQWNPTTGKWESIGDTDSTNTAVTDPLRQKLTLIDEILNSPGMKGSVGAYRISRWTPVRIDKSAKAEFNASVQQLVSQETIDRLLNLKKAGGTLGALSDQERVMLQSAATKINTWYDAEKGKYIVSEAAFKKEIENIQDLTKKALKRADPGYNLSEDENYQIDVVWNSGMAGTTTAFNAESYYSK